MRKSNAHLSPTPSSLLQAELRAVPLPWQQALRRAHGSRECVALGAAGMAPRPGQLALRRAHGSWHCAAPKVAGIAPHRR